MPPRPHDRSSGRFSLPNTSTTTITITTTKREKMPPRKKTNALFIPAKTLPGRSGRGPVNPPSTSAKDTTTTTTTKKPRVPDLQDKGWLDKEKLAELDRNRELKGLPSLMKKKSETKAEEEVEKKTVEVEVEAKAKAEEKEKVRDPEPEPEPEPKEQSRFSAEGKGKGKMPALVELAAAETTTTETTTEAPGLPETSLVEVEQSISVPATVASLEPAVPSVVIDEQSETFWKLISFFNAAPPLLLPAVPTQPPTTTTTNKAAPVPPAPSISSQVQSSSPALTCALTPPSSPPTASCPSPPSTPDDDDDDNWDSMSFVWGGDDPMWQSGWDFQHKPALSIYKPNPWTEPNHELNTIMTVEVEDGAFDVAQWARDQYDANVAPAATCKFEHPANRPSGNPFAPLQNTLQSGSNTRGSTAADYYLTRDAIQKDLQEERPEWILSAYGPGRDAPEQLWGGILEQSPEEMRLHAMTCEAAGNLQGAVSRWHLPSQLM